MHTEGARRTVAQYRMDERSVRQRGPSWACCRDPACQDKVSRFTMVRVSSPQIHGREHKGTFKRTKTSLCGRQHIMPFPCYRNMCLMAR